MDIEDITFSELEALNELENFESSDCVLAFNPIQRNPI